MTYTTVSRQGLLNALEDLKHTTGAKASPPINSIEVTNGVLLSADEDVLTLVTTNFTGIHRIELTIRGEGSWSMVVPHQKFEKSLTGLKEQDVTLTPLDEQTIRVSAGPQNATIIKDCLKPEDFPSIPSEHGPVLTWVFSESDILRAAFSRVGFCANKDQARPAFTGVLLDVGKDVLTLVAADGWRLAWERVNCNFYSGHQDAFLVSAKGLEALLKAAPKVRTDLSMAFYPNNDGNQFDRLRVSWGSHTFWVSSVRETYPDWRRIANPGVPDVILRLKADELAQAATVVGALVKDTTNILGLSFPNPEWLEVHSAGEGLVVSRSVACEQMARERVFDMAVSEGYLVAGVKSFKGQTIRVSLRGHLKPLHITPDGQTDWEERGHAIMPLHGVNDAMLTFESALEPQTPSQPDLTVVEC